MKADLRLGDCAEVLQSLESNSIDSIVTDPPYGLSFMGKAWDYDVPSAAIWKECLRVLKPGGHLLSFFGSRTYHRGVVQIEDAGFEIRDQIMWVYGSGFPKSLDVSKAIDKAAGAERRVLGVSPNDRPNSQVKGGKAFDRALDAGQDHAPLSLTAPATPEAQQWSGWGTALKPSHEPVVVARKPLIGTVAENVLAYGTGGINVDGCRIEATDGYTENAVTQGINTARTSYEHRRERRTFEPAAAGRWPSNLIHDGSEEVVELFPQTGPSSPFVGNGGSRSVLHNSGCEYSGTGYSDSGSAARFFYCAKASKDDRQQGNAHPTVKPTDLMAYLCRLVTPPHGTVLDPFMGSGSTIKAALSEGFNAIGIERDPAYFKMAEQRTNGAQLGLALMA